MTLRLKIELIVGAVLLLGAVFGAKVWLDEHDSRIKAEASVAAQQQLQQQYQAQVSDLAKRMDEREAAYQTQLKTLDQRFQTAASPTQIAQLVSQLMGLKTPITISTPQSTAQNPNPQPVATVSTLDAPQVKAYVETCETCKLNLAKATADAADRQAQASLAQLQIDSLKKENTSLQQAVKGGTFFQRFGKAAKYLIIGAAIGAVAAKAH